MRIAEAKRLARLSEWQHLVESQKGSGMSIRDWCKQNELTEQQFYYRLRHVREVILESLESPQSASLVRIPCIDNCQPLKDKQSPVGIIVRYHSVAVEFPANTDASTIAGLIKELER